MTMTRGELLAVPLLAVSLVTLGFGCGSDSTSSASGKGGTAGSGGKGGTAGSGGKAGSGGISTGGSSTGGAVNGGTGGSATGGSAGSSIGGNAGAGGAPAVASRPAIWSAQFGGVGAQQVEAIATPATGSSVVVVGQMQNAMPVGAKTLTSNGSYDAFAIELDAAGQVVWSLSFGDAGDQRATHALALANGHSVIGGFTQPSSNLGFGTGPQTGGTIFILEVDQNGAYVRGGVVPSTGNTRLTGLAVGPSDTILYAFDLPPASSLTAGCVPPNQYLYSNTGSTPSIGVVELAPDFSCVRDMGMIADGALGLAVTTGDVMLVSTTQSGAPPWVGVPAFPFSDWTAGSNVLDAVQPNNPTSKVDSFTSAVDGSGGLVMAGGYDGSVHVNGTVLSPTTGGEAAFVARADATGTVSWFRDYSAAATGSVTSVSAMSTSASAFIAGSGQGIYDFGAGPVLPIGKTTAFDSGYFVAHLDGTGNALWATRFAHDAGFAQIFVTSALDDIAFVAGALNGSADLGNGALVSAGDDDVFIAKYAP